MLQQGRFPAGGHFGPDKTGESARPAAWSSVIGNGSCGVLWPTKALVVSYHWAGWLPDEFV